MTEATIAYNVTHLTTMMFLANGVVSVNLRKCRDLFFKISLWKSSNSK